MDVIYIIKALIIGCLGAGGYYFVISFIFHYFPMPLYIKLQTILTSWAGNKTKKKGDFADRVWNIGRGILIGTMLLTWLAIFAFFAYLLYNFITYYIPVEGNLKWSYYGIAVTLPSLWMLLKLFSFIPKKKQTSVQANPPQVAQKTLMEQMIGE